MNGNTIIGISFQGARPMRSLLAHDFDDDNASQVDSSGLKIRAADSFGERSSASILIDRMYATRGYKSNPLPSDIDPNQLTLVASDHERVVGTLTLGFDSDDGLLVDDLFPDEVDALRRAGREVCEFTKLAMDSVVRSQRVLAAMFHVAFIHAHRIRGCRNLLIEVNPRHVRFYEAKLGFQPLSEPRQNRRVEAPAVLMSLDLIHAHQQIDKFGGRPELSATERSLYPYSFSVREEAAIVGRLRGRFERSVQAAQLAA